MKIKPPDAAEGSIREADSNGEKYIMNQSNLIVNQNKGKRSH